MAWPHSHRHRVVHIYFVQWMFVFRLKPNVPFELEKRMVRFRIVAHQEIFDGEMQEVCRTEARCAASGKSLL